jgi:hypothetical protein
VHLVPRFLLSIGALVSLGIGDANAQADPGLSWVPADSPLACLERVDGNKKPTYPADAAALRRGATVRVNLSFVKADAPPKVEVSFNSSGEDFVDAVTAFAKGYRLPCMTADAKPVAGVQEFQFVPDDGRKVVTGAVRDHPKMAEGLRCVTGAEHVPMYPSTLGLASPRPLEGTVVVMLKFVDGTSPPQPKVLFDGGSHRLAATVLASVERYRMPCLVAGDPPLTVMRSFMFSLSGSTRYALKDVQLRQFVGAIDKLEQHSVRFDFSTMSCPFDVRLQLLQPHAPNYVGELDRADPNRREFVEWLRTVSLKLPRDAARQVIGQQITVSVPCGVLDLS